MGEEKEAMDGDVIDLVSGKYKYKVCFKINNSKKQKQGEPAELINPRPLKMAKIFEIRARSTKQPNNQAKSEVFE